MGGSRTSVIGQGADFGIPHDVVGVESHALSVRLTVSVIRTPENVKPFGMEGPGAVIRIPRAIITRKNTVLKGDGSVVVGYPGAVSRRSIVCDCDVIEG